MHTMHVSTQSLQCTVLYQVVDDVPLPYQVKMSGQEQCMCRSSQIKGEQCVSQSHVQEEDFAREKSRSAGQSTMSRQQLAQGLGHANFKHLVAIPELGEFV